jgi:hypothetical protein
MSRQTLGLGNREPDYWLREKERLAIVDDIRTRADSFAELGAVCPECGHRIWEAQAGTLVYRGCHCMTFCFPPGHWLYDFNADNWAAAVALHSQSHPHRASFSRQN